MLREERKKIQKDICFFGRRHGKSLSQTQQILLNELLPKLTINLNQLDDPFAGTTNIEQLHLEIGFGGGEYLLHHAKIRPNTGFIGVEPFISSMVKLLKCLDAEPGRAKNIRLYNDDAAKLLRLMPNDSLNGIDLFYPDPWQKKKHNKRRFVNKENLEHIVRILKNGGCFRFASDISEYINWTLIHCEQNGYLKWQANKASDWQNPYPNWISTRYEQKAIAENRRPTYLSFIAQKK